MAGNTRRVGQSCHQYSFHIDDHRYVVYDHNYVYRYDSFSFVAERRAMAKKKTTPRTVHVEYLYLDLKTCRRCRATDASLKQALAALSGVFDALGYKVRLDETEMSSRTLAKQYRFLSSPTIRVNGVDIETAVKESDCADCGSISGCGTDCRVFTWQGKDYEQPPAGLIVDGILRVLYGDQKTKQKPYVMPKNLDRFFTGVESHHRHSKKGSTMASINVYEPALCCNTGVCGPDPDQALVQFTADLAALKKQGIKIARHNLANDPEAFTKKKAVRKFMKTAGSAGLPLTTIGKTVVLTGRYPTLDELTRFAGRATNADADTECGCGDGSSCGCGSSGCC